MTATRLQNSAPGGAGGAAAAVGTKAGVPAGTTTLGDDNGGRRRVEQRRGSSRCAGPLATEGVHKVQGRPAGWQVGPVAAPYRATSAAPATASGPRA